MSQCQLCGAEGGVVQALSPSGEAVLCDVCTVALAGEVSDGPHWQCLHEAVWSVDPVVQGMAWRVLHKLGAPWANDVIDMCDPEPSVRDWALAEGVSQLVHRDSNGAVLAAGDTVTLIKDLPVKGAGFTAKRGTAVRGISLVADNAGHIEGRVEGQRIVILTEFVKKS